MRLPAKPVLLGAGLLAAGLCAVSIVSADEIRLKDGKKLYGVIVGYEDNMFKVKTDFGYVLVEKDKIAQIIPSTPAQGDAAKGEPQPAAKPSTEAQPKPEPAVAGSSRPALPTANAGTTDTPAPTLKTSAGAPKTTLATAAAPPPPTKEESPANRE